VASHEGSTQPLVVEPGDAGQMRGARPPDAVSLTPGVADCRRRHPAAGAFVRGGRTWSQGVSSVYFVCFMAWCMEQCEVW
jgi:hypothetical protein